jgi:hypothetical protein
MDEIGEAKIAIKNPSEFPINPNGHTSTENNSVSEDVTDSINPTINSNTTEATKLTPVVETVISAPVVDEAVSSQAISRVNSQHVESLQLQIRLFKTLSKRYVDSEIPKQLDENSRPILVAQMVNNSPIQVPPTVSEPTSQPLPVAPVSQPLPAPTYNRPTPNYSSNYPPTTAPNNSSNSYPPRPQQQNTFEAGQTLTPQPQNGHHNPQNPLHPAGNPNLKPSSNNPIPIQTTQNPQSIESKPFEMKVDGGVVVPPMTGAQAAPPAQPLSWQCFSSLMFTGPQRPPDGMISIAPSVRLLWYLYNHKH